jgi:hypothetical protein
MEKICDLHDSHAWFHASHAWFHASHVLDNQVSVIPKWWTINYLTNNYDSGQLPMNKTPKNDNYVVCKVATLHRITVYMKFNFQCGNTCKTLRLLYQNIFPFAHCSLLNHVYDCHRCQNDGVPTAALLGEFGPHQRTEGSLQNLDSRLDHGLDCGLNYGTWTHFCSC